MNGNGGEMTQPGPRELKESETAFIEWLEKTRSSEIPGGAKYYAENGGLFADTYQLWQISQKVGRFVRDGGEDLNAAELKWLYDVIEGKDGQHPVLHGLNRSNVREVINDIQGCRVQKIVFLLQSVSEQGHEQVDYRSMLIEHDMRKIFAPRNLGRIMIINNPNHTMALEEGVNTLVGGFHNTVGYREKFGNRLFPALRLIIGHAQFGDMKDLGNLEEVTEWAGFDNGISPPPEPIQRFAIKRIAGKNLTRDDIRKIIAQEICEFGRPKKILQE